MNISYVEFDKISLGEMIGEGEGRERRERPRERKRERETESSGNLHKP